ncbi:carbon dioxide-concentrating mechanism protein [Crocosphaera sp. UHCC 0190]|uniref:carbon dioxide-concentrating mechanism protein n=1 Tax=Crocosphaera sp. UHCC 0190 TaxID=3110246 RepID=UPI002B213708|nr:carbon dioxide-concentrating mechanism protein [Crocosphaera sp. UHCC 0190]MEA5509853.1 carbon dioxide-concentrating mechanism protein [Crocosphaera sp. UHCC 0190]
MTKLAASNPRQAPRQRMKSSHLPSDSALGLVSTKSFPAIVGTADMMLKSADVTLVGYEKIGSGYCTAVIRGKVANVRLAVEEGAKTAEKFGQLLSKLVIPRPMPNLEAIFPIGSHLVEIAQQQQGYSRLSNRSIGLLETRGFPAMVGAADAMLKSADVQLASYEIIGDGLCTAIIRGSVANVAVAIEAGMHEAERIGELHAMMVIPRLLEDLEHTLPVASCWVDQGDALPMLMPTTVKQRELIALPELEKRPLVMKKPAEIVEPVEVETQETYEDF